MVYNLLVWYSTYFVNFVIGFSNFVLQVNCILPKIFFYVVNWIWNSCGSNVLFYSACIQTYGLHAPKYVKVEIFEFDEEKLNIELGKLLNWFKYSGMEWNLLFFLFSLKEFIFIIKLNWFCSIKLARWYCTICLHPI